LSFCVCAQNAPQINWWKSQKIFLGGGFGMGWSDRVDPHMQYTMSVAGGPSTGPYDSEFQTFFTTFSGSLSYYPSRLLSLHLKAGQQSHKLEVISDQDGRIHMRFGTLQARLNVFQAVRNLGTIHNIYLGGGIGSYGYDFWKENGTAKTEVDFESTLGSNFVAGTEWMFMGKAADKMNILFYMELTADLATFDFASATEGGHTYTIDVLTYDDWRQVNCNAFGIEMGLRFSLFNKQLPLIYH
jgi:hypothetical protein